MSPKSACHPECLFLCRDSDVPSTTLLDLCYVELQEIIEPGEKLLSAGWAPLATRVLYERRTCLDSPMVGERAVFRTTAVRTQTVMVTCREEFEPEDLEGCRKERVCSCMLRLDHCLLRGIIVTNP